MGQSIRCCESLRLAVRQASEETLLSAHPQNAGRIFNYTGNVESLFTPFTETDLLELPVAPNFTESEHSSAGTHPDRSGAIFIKSGNDLGIRLLRWNVSFELWL